MTEIVEKIESVIELLKSVGYVADGQTRTEHVAFVTRNTYPLRGRNATFGGRLRFAKGTDKVTVGKRTVYFYGEGYGHRFNTSEVGAIKNYLFGGGK